MTIRNPVLRFAAGLVVFATAAVVFVFMIHGIGSFREPWYAQKWPLLYADAGYGFWTAALEGFWVFLAVFFALVILGLAFTVCRLIGNLIFGPKYG